MPLKPLDLLAHAIRAKEIIAVLARHGFSEWLEQLDLPQSWYGRLVRRPAVKHSTWERARLAAEELGPTFIKVGQLMSMRPDILPQPLVLELRKLQDQVEPEPFGEIRAVLATELEADPAQVFATFDEKPAAAASLAQVHFATLRADGRRVAVKIQRPGVSRTIGADLDLLAFLASQAHARISLLRPYDLPAIVEEIREGVLRELDFRNEARNQEYFTALNPDPGTVFAPRVVPGMCTRRVLVMERIDGVRLESSSLTPEQARELAVRGARSLLHQVLVLGFFHADPHGGNLLVTSDRRLCLLDWGLVGHLTRRLRVLLADLFIAAAAQDAERIVELASDLAAPGSKPDYRTMEKEIILTLRESFNFTVGKPQVGRTILRLLHIFGSNGISVARDYSLMAKAVLSIEDAGRQLDPEFDLPKVAEPIVRELHSESWKPGRLWQQARSFVTGGMARLQELPGDFERILRRVERDDLTINFQHRGLESLDDALGKASNRIALGVIIGSLIVGSSLIITTGIKPHLFNYPALGIIGYIISAMLGLWVVWDIFRHSRHK